MKSQPWNGLGLALDAKSDRDVEPREGEGEPKQPNKAD